MTIAKAMQADKAFCRRRNTWALARWRAKHRQRYNEYQREYQRRYQVSRRTLRLFRCGQSINFLLEFL